MRQGMEKGAIYTGSGDMGGKISVKFNDNHSLIALCETMFAGFNADQHEPIALRLYAGEESFLTLYALDKFRQETSSTNSDKLPVHKFKREIESPLILLEFFSEFNCTLGAGNFPLDDMEVVNR